jgi:hypothetical protein
MTNEQEEEFSKVHSLIPAQSIAETELQREMSDVIPGHMQTMPTRTRKVASDKR